MKSKSIDLKQLTEGNSRLCLSAKRALKLCYECEQYDKCESKIVNSEFDILQSAKNNAKKNYDNLIEEIDKEIKNLRILWLFEPVLP